MPDREHGDGGGSKRAGPVRAVGGVAVGAVKKTVTGTASFGTGVLCVARGLKRLLHTPWLWPYAAAPVVIAFLILVGTLWWLVNWLVPTSQAFVSEHLWDWAASIAGVFTAMTLIGAWLVAMYVAFPAVVRVVAAPFLALLADKVYSHVSGCEPPTPPGPRWVRWIVMPVWESLILLAVRVVVMLVALPLLCIPVAGTAAFFCALLPIEGLDLMDLAQSARAVPLRERMRYVRRNLLASSGLGLGAAGILLLPIVNVFLLPSLVVGAVLLDERTSPDFRGAGADPSGALPGPTA